MGTSKMIWLWLPLASVISALFYRLGGAAEDKRWYNFLKKNAIRIRDAWVPLITLGLMIWVFKVDVAIWVHAVAFLLSFAALTTYWDDLFGGWDNFYMHGGMIGLAYLPYAITGAISWQMLGLRIVILALGMGLWSKYNDDHIWEECGRGAIIPLSMVVYLGG